MLLLWLKLIHLIPEDTYLVENDSFLLAKFNFFAKKYYMSDK